MKNTIPLTPKHVVEIIEQGLHPVDTLLDLARGIDYEADGNDFLSATIHFKGFSIDTYDKSVETDNFGYGETYEDDNIGLEDACRERFNEAI